ncbi:MAG TPA: glycosyl hydrolase family 28 protein [Actinospica sp.]|jgi:polygalacturonase|nr:glycosyl hydrolase family 28 protein [Actinospica sp.]
MRKSLMSLPLLALAGMLLTALPATPAAAASLGDQRTVTEPTLPGTCETLTSTLATPSSRTFSSSQESTPPDTSRIQSALNSCLGTGKAVVLAASGSDTAFLSAPLTVGGGEYLVIDTGVTLFASRVASQYQSSSGTTCGTISSSTSSGCNAFITVNGANAGIEGTQSSSGSQGAIDGRGDLDIYGTSASWWANAATAKADGDKQVNPRLIQAGANNFTVFHVDLENSPKEHLYYEGGTGFTVWGIRIKTVDTALNTDGIDIDSTKDATVEDSYIMDGDDCVAMQTNSAEDEYLSVIDNHCYGTHGISIGSETTYGVNSVLVNENWIQGTDTNGTESSSANGIRVKSYSKVGGTVSNVEYEDTCMTKLKYPIEINPFYSSSTGSDYPYFKSITINGATETSSVSSASSAIEGYSSSYPLGLTLENVSLDSNGYSAEYANVSYYNSTIVPSGTGVTSTKISGSGSAPSCSFASFPSL